MDIKVYGNAPLNTLKETKKSLSQYTSLNEVNVVKES